MQTLIDEVAAAAEHERLFAGVSRLLVGCSGGGDSTALVDILSRVADSFDLTLAVAHLDHGWRGADADADLERVEFLARSRRLEFFAERVHGPEGSGSREEAARRARLDFFERVADEWEGDAVALGHTADDQVETIVLNLARGSGRRGLGGMRPRSTVGDLMILRPLLGRRRGELRAYADERGLPFSDDPTNDDISLARNRLRHRLLGELLQVNPAAVENISRTAELVREEDDWLEHVASETLGIVAVDEAFPGGLSLDANLLSELPRPLQRRVVRIAIGRVRGHRRGISHEHVESVVGGPDSQSLRARDLPGVRVRRERGRIRLLPLEGRRLARPKTG